MSIKLADHLSKAESNSFNLVRLIAGTGVIFGHSFVLLGKKQQEPIAALTGFTYSAGISVYVFFMISGIFVTQSFAKDPSLLAFAIKRFFRIWPALIVCLFLTAVATVSILDNMDRLVYDPSVYEYIVNNAVLSMTWGIPGIYDGRPDGAINGSLWSLLLEVKMYVFVAVVGVMGVVATKNALLPVVCMLGALVPTFPALVGSTGPSDYAHFVIPVLYFLLGMGLYASRDSAIFSTATVPISFAIYLGTHGLTSQISFHLLIVSCTLWFATSPLARKIRLPGDYSYGVYLYGFPIQQIVISIYPEIGPYNLFFIAFVVALVLAALSWRIIERPAQESAKALAHATRSISLRGVRVAPMVRPIILPGLVLTAASFGVAATTSAVNARPPRSMGAKITAYGPSTVAAGQAFNAVSGRSAIWVTVSEKIPGKPRIILGGTPLETIVGDDVITALVPVNMTAEAGIHPLVIEVVRHGIRYQTEHVNFIVE